MQDRAPTLRRRESLEVIGNNNPRQMNITPSVSEGYRIRLISTEPKMKNPPLCGGFFCFNDKGLQFFLKYDIVLV